MALRRALPVLVLTLAGLIGLDASPAEAETAYTVTTTGDTLNGGDGLLSLREALDLANGDGDDSRITLVAGQVHTLTRCDASAPQETANFTGDLNAADNDDEDLVLVGNGATIEQLCPDERVLSNFGAALRLEGLTVTGGDLDVTENTSGGGIHSATSVVTLVGSAVVGNTAQLGGGIFANGVVLEESLLSGNEAAVGGAVHLTDLSQTFTATDSSVVGNTANNIPGVQFSSAGIASLTNTTLGGSTANALNNSVATELNLPNGNATFVHSTIVGTANGPATRVGGTMTSFGSVFDGGPNIACHGSETTVSQGYNIEGPFDTCGFGSGAGNGTDVVQASTGFGAPTDNGGAGPTFLPTDEGIVDHRIPVAQCHPTVTTDARGQVRGVGGGCEPGAIERPPVFAADALIRNSSQTTFVGNDVINLTGAGQTRSQNRGVGRRATFFLRVQNDGDTPGDFRVRGPAGTNRFFVRYFLGTTTQNVTGAVVAGTQVLADVPAGAVRLVRVEVTPRAAAPRNAVIGVPVRFTSLDDTTRRDVVKARVKRV